MSNEVRSAIGRCDLAIRNAERGALSNSQRDWFDADIAFLTRQQDNKLHSAVLSLGDRMRKAARSKKRRGVRRSGRQRSRRGGFDY